MDDEEELEEYDDEEYGEEAAGDDVVGDSVHQSGLDSEDPKVIKELIDLIKKVGGIEELEKQLKQNQDGLHVLYDPNQPSRITTTPSPAIHKKLYEKILRKPIQSTSVSLANASIRDVTIRAEATTESSLSSVSSASSQLPKYSSIYRASNSRPAPQNEGLRETEGLRNDKPQYITITRNRPQTSAAPVAQDDEAEDGSDDELRLGEASSEDISVARSTESTFVRYTIPEHVEVTGHDDSYRGGFDDGQAAKEELSSTTPYVTIYRATPQPVYNNDGGSSSVGAGKIQSSGGGSM